MNDPLGVEPPNEPRRPAAPPPDSPSAASGDGDGVGDAFEPNAAMQFGEVEELAPDVELRPDRNKHYAVVAVGQPSEEDLPIFVDLDSLRDMELHALDDTSVELGGVMLGGQYVDRDGRPFVVISDSLRATHYESTKGSFKFTHETWREITRQRNEFPDDLQMVGWYHTHPDWGVFLSSMDMFICDHFFNKELDVALVIDPCRQDRGMFMWTGDSQERVRRTDGFYLISSRFREEDLQYQAALLEGSFSMPMPYDPRQAAPQIVQVGGAPPWLAGAMVGLLALQMCLLALLAWRVLLPPDAAPDGAARDAVAAAELEALQRVRRERADVDARLEVLDQALSGLRGSPPARLVEMGQLQAQLNDAQASLRGHTAREKELTEERRAAEARLQAKESLVSQLRSDLDVAAEKLESLTAAKATSDAELKRLQKELGIEGDEDEISFWRKWALPIAGGLLVAIAAAASVFYLRRNPAPPELE